MPERSSNIKQRTLFVTNCAAWFWNKVLLAKLKEENTLAAIVVATGQRVRWEFGYYQPNVDGGTGNKCMFLPPALIILA